MRKRGLSKALRVKGVQSGLVKGQLVPLMLMVRLAHGFRIRFYDAAATGAGTAAGVERGHRIERGSLVRPSTAADAAAVTYSRACTQLTVTVAAATVAATDTAGAAATAQP